jgi:hypothetical protein
MVRARTACAYIPDAQNLEGRLLKITSPQNDCGYGTPRFCWHDFLRESTAEAFVLVQPRKFDRRTKGRDTLSRTDSAEMHVLRQLEKTIFRPATRCNHKEMRIDSHRASASDAPMPTTRCPKSARRRRQSQSGSTCHSTTLRAPANSSSYRTDVPKCATIIAVGGPTKSCNSKGPPPTITTMRRFGRRERIRTSRAETSRYGHICYQNAYCSPSRVTVDE